MAFPILLCVNNAATVPNFSDKILALDIYEHKAETNNPYLRGIFTKLDKNPSRVEKLHVIVAVME